MNVEIYVDTLDKNSEHYLSTCEIIRQLITHYANNIGLPIEHLRHVFIADEKNYGDAIHTLNAGEGYTDDGVAVGVGKSIIHREPPIQSSIVLAAMLVHGVIVFQQDRVPFDDWPADIQFFSYVIHHELGHCLDHHIRLPSKIRGNLITPEGLFKIQYAANIEYQFLLSEIAACMLSAKALSPTAHQKRMNMSHGMIVDKLQVLRQLITDYDGSGNQLFNIALQATKATWFVISQYATSQTMRRDNPQLQSIPLSVWPDAPANMGTLLQRLEQEVISLIASYPNWPNVIPDALLNIWLQIALACGYKFVEATGNRAGGDAIFFNVVSS